MPLSILILTFVRLHRRPYALAAAMLATISLLTVTVPHRVGQIVDALVAHRLDQAALLQQLSWLLATGVVIYLLRVGWRLQLFKAAYQFGVDLRTRLYARLSLQGPGFYQHQRTGNLMALATNDIDAIEMVAGEAMLAGFDGSLTLALVVASMLFGVDWRLTLVALLPFPLMAFAFWRISSRVHVHSGRALQRFSALNNHVQESLTGVRTVRALGAQPQDARRFAALADEVAEADLSAQRWEAAFEPAVGLTITAATVLTLGVGGYLVWHQTLTIGALTSFSMYLALLIWPMFAAGWVLSLVERARAAWHRLEPVLAMPASMPDEGPIDTVPAGQLCLSNVSLTYPGQATPALDAITLQLAPGSTLGVVGPTGSGKSSLIRLLLRQHAPDAGSIKWGPHALADYRLSRLREAISWVPQEAFLFSATIAENIALARPDASRADVEQAARLAAIHDDILHWPQGYETAVGERGITLSGGQRQRVALARALLARAELLLLDDALSAVDTLTESRILQHLRSRHPDAAAAQRAGEALAEPSDAARTAESIHAPAPPRRQTAVIATHRLSAVADADWIVVLRAGRIIAAGTHAQLLAQAGWYAAQWEYQQLEASLDAA